MLESRIFTKAKSFVIMVRKGKNDHKILPLTTTFPIVRVITNLTSVNTFNMDLSPNCLEKYSDVVISNK